MRAALFVLCIVATAACSRRVIREYTSVGVGIGGGPAGDVAAAASASAINRAAGRCFADCRQGQRCNEKTGYCEEVVEPAKALDVFFNNHGHGRDAGHVDTDVR